MNDPVVLAAIISTIGAIIGVAASWFFSRTRVKSEVDKNTADASESVSTSVTLLLDKLNNRIKDLTDEVKRIEEERKIEKEGYDKKIGEMEGKIGEMEKTLKYREGKMQELRGGMDVLLGQLKQANIPPKYLPDDD